MALLHIAYLALLTNFIIFRLCGNLRIRSKYRKLWPVAIITVEYRSKSLKKINFFASHSDMCSINSTAYAFETFRTRYFNEHSFDIINEPLIYTLLRAHVNYSYFQIPCTEIDSAIYYIGPTSWLFSTLQSSFSTF